MKLERIDNFVRQSARDLLRDFRVCPVPVLRLWLHCQIRWLRVIASDLLKMADVDFANPLKPAFRWILKPHPEHVPVVRERDHREPAD